MNLNKLPIKNIFFKIGRSVSLLSFAVLLSIVTFGGVLIVSSLRNGLFTLEKRLGADLIVVPSEVKNSSSLNEILLNGNRTKIYMTKDVLQKLSEIEGVEAVSPQFYLSSLTAGCCSETVEIIGFDSKTDFTIQPWIRETYKDELRDGEIFVGSKIEIPENRTLKFFGHDFKVASGLHQTGSGLDNAVYANLNTLKIMADEYAHLGEKFKVDPINTISSVMIKVKNGYSIEKLRDYINIHNKDIRAVASRNLTTDVSDSLSSIASIIGVLIVFVWILCLLIMCIVFSMIINERKKEFAVLRAVGVSSKKLSKLILTESVILSVSGGVIGIFLVLLIVLPFNNLIAQSLKMPYLLPNFLFVIALALFTILISAISGAISSIIKVKQISKQDTSLILREN